MNDMAQVIIPRSDQINADSLLSGPINIIITSVDIKAGSEQPITIHYQGEDGKPWRPCKSMARCLVAAWGPDSKAYIGRSLTLYCDPKVKWGGLEVGGIRVSHMSNIDSALTMALTVTRGSKKPYTVKPLTATERKPAQPVVATVTESDSPVINAAQHRRLEARINEIGIDREKVKKYCIKNWACMHLNELNQEQYDVIDQMLDDYAAKNPKADKPVTDGGLAQMVSDTL